ncbi:DUF72 domain-containing protein [Rhizobium leguminosarum]|uniref:DUF72 domain-containing protein n=1 Tax=Rhizobium leguminosarum TaxID=384 RepID=UPI003F9E5E05
MAKKTGTVRIGISGWTYAPWRGQFYPEDLPQKQELSYAARHFRSIEINGTFDPDLFENFLALLPHDGETAADLARRHDGHVKGPAWLESDGHRPIRHALEIRHESFRSPAFIEMLRRHKVALVCADTVKWPPLMDITTDFVYCRLHGSEKLYVSGYEDEALDIWAERIRAWATGGEPENATRVLAPVAARSKARDVYLYFDNTDVKLRAPIDADHLSQRLADLMPGSGPKAA